MSARACLTYLATTALLATLAACGASTPSNTDQDTAVSGTGEDVGNDPADTATGPDDAVPRLTLVSSPPPLGTDAHPRLVLASTKPATLWVFGACGPRSFPIAAGSNEVELAEDGPWPDGEYADCTVQAIGNDGGVGDTVAIPAFAIDTVAPTVTSVVPVPPAVASASPIVVLSVSEAAEVAWSGCSGPATLAAGAEVQVTLAGANGSPLVDGSYPDCSLAPRDAAGNVGEILALPPFVVDTVAPTFTLVTGPGERTNDPRPQVTVAVDEVITLGATGACRASTQVLAAGTRDLRLTAPGGGDLSDGTFTDCALVASDTAGHEVSMAIPGFTIDTVAPAVSDVEPPRASGNNPRPLLVLTASEAGWLELDGDCASASTAVTAGANSVALHGPDDAPLTDGQKSCGLRLQDLAGNPSERFAIPPFTIDTVPPTLTLVSWPPPSGNSSLVAIEVSASEGGRLGAGGPCRPSPLEIGAGITRVNLTGAEGPLDDGLYADCTVSLVDDAGNDSAIVSVPAFRIDTPSLDFISLPPTYGTDRHPALTIWTSHAGDVRIFGGCEPSVDAIAAGVQTLGLGGSGSGPGLADGAYACTFELTNTAGRSATIAIPEFHIDNVAPTLSATGPAAPTNAPVAEVVVAEAVTLSGTGCRPGVTTLVAGTHIVPLTAAGGAPLADGVHADCALTASDVVGNASAPVTLAPFIVDRTPPTLAEVVPAPATGEDPVRAVVVSTTEAASLVFSSGCPPADVDALAVGETTITFTATLGAGVTACAVTATDAVGNASAPLHLTPFYVNTPGFIENHKKNGMAVIYQDIQATPDGGYLLASEKTLTRLDAQMSPVWSRELSGVSPRALAIGPGGYAIVTGTTSGDLGAGFGDAFLMRVEANGDITWVRTYGLSNTPDDLDGVAIVGQGAIIAVGRTYVHNDGGHQGWVVHADTDGTLIGSQVYGGSGYEQFSAIVPGDGATKRIVGRISTTLDSPDDPLLVEIWLTGDVWEARRYTANWDDDFRAVAAGPNGSIYAVGRTVSFWPPAYDDPVYYNGVVAKIDFSNDLVWERSIGGVATAVTAFGGGVVVGGYAFDYGDDWNEGDFPDYTEGDAQDGILVAFDPDGTALWTRIYETGAKIDINGLVPTADGGVLAVGKERWTGIWDYGVFAKLDAGGNVDDAYCGELRRIPAEHGAIPVTFGATSVSMPVKDLAVTVTTVNPALIQPYLFDLTVTGVCE